MKGISILGSTGSIGCNSLKVIEHLKEFRVVALAAGRNMKKFAEQVAAFGPEIASCESDECAESLLKELQTTHVVRCDEPALVFLGLSFAGWNVVGSLAIMALALKAAFAAREPSLTV